MVLGMDDGHVRCKSRMRANLNTSQTLIMEAYDNHLLSGFFSLPAFQQQFGERIHGKKVQYELNPAWQSGLGEAAKIAFGG